MTGKSSRKSVDALYWQGRLRAARDHLRIAHDAATLSEPGQNASPVVSLIVLAAIAYCDSLTAKRAQVVNQQDHALAPRLLRDVLRNTLPDSQERRLRRMLSLKDEAHYGARMTPLDEAKRLLTELESFARWTEDMLQ